MTSGLSVVQILPFYKNQLDDLIQQSYFLHQHSDWLQPTDIFETGLSFLISGERQPYGAIGFSEAVDQTRWLQFFSVFVPNVPVAQIWHTLWQDQKLIHAIQTDQIFSIPTDQQFAKLLRQTKFRAEGSIVYLETDRVKPVTENYHEQLEAYRYLSVEPRDALLIHKHLESAFPPVWRLSEQNVLQATLSSDFSVKILQNNDLIGYLLANFDEESVHISRLAVRTDIQMKGIGKRLIQKLQMFAEEKAVRYWSVNTYSRNKSAIRFYERFGFSLCDRDYPVYNLLNYPRT